MGTRMRYDKCKPVLRRMQAGVATNASRYNSATARVILFVVSRYRPVRRRIADLVLDRDHPRKVWP